MDIEKPKHYRAIKVKYMPFSKKDCSNIKITDERCDQSITIGKSIFRGNSLLQAIEYLIDKGFNVIGYGQMKDHYIVFCDNWDDQFIYLNK